jgi:putative membrane protein
MHYAAAALVLFVGVEHIYILVLEMFLWATPRGMRTFRRTREEQESTKVLAANQGLYNGFLAAGLFWSFLVPAEFAFDVRAFFLGCVIVAGLYGGATAARRIWIVQALPASIAMAVLLAEHFL